MELQNAVNTDFPMQQVMHGQSLDFELPMTYDPVEMIPAASVVVFSTGGSRLVDGLESGTSEETLVAAAKRGDHEAFADLWDQCSDGIRRQVFRIVEE